MAHAGPTGPSQVSGLPRADLRCRCGRSSAPAAVTDMRLDRPPGHVSEAGTTCRAGALSAARHRVPSAGRALLLLDQQADGDVGESDALQHARRLEADCLRHPVRGVAHDELDRRRASDASRRDQRALELSLDQSWLEHGGEPRSRRAERTICGRATRTSVESWSRRSRTPRYGHSGEERGPDGTSVTLPAVGVPPRGGRAPWHGRGTRSCPPPRRRRSRRAASRSARWPRWGRR